MPERSPICRMSPRDEPARPPFTRERKRHAASGLEAVSSRRTAGRFTAAARALMTRRLRAAICLFAIAIAPAAARAQDPAPPATPQDKPEERPTGLPARVTWTFNFDAGWGTFGFANSLYDNPKVPGVEENLSDQWFEGYVKPALSATYTFASSSEVYGKVSVV